MNKVKKLGYIAVAWLCLCLILLLAACSTLHNAGSEQPIYRVTITLQPGSNETELIAALNDSHPANVDFKPFNHNYDNNRLLNGSRLVVITLTNEAALKNFRQQLQNAGVPLQALHIQRIN